MNHGRRQPALVVVFFLVAALGVLGACAGVQIKTRRGITHEVREGETLWRICHTYGANMKTVCRLNRIVDPERLRLGQKLFIPGAARILRVDPAPDPSDRTGRTGVADGGRAPEVRGIPSTGASGLGEGRSPSRKTPAKNTSLRFIWPVRGPVTSWFGIRHGRRHDGIDIAVPKGTLILAAESGIVVYSGNQVKGYGNVVIVKHREGFSTVYAHNSANRAKVDQLVSRGEVIAFAGRSGLARGVHLHFEIRAGVRAVDPMDYLP